MARITEKAADTVWGTVVQDVNHALTREGLEIQLFLAALAIAIALFASTLSQRLARQKWPKGSEHEWVAFTALPMLLSPALVIAMLLIASWIATIVIPFYKHQRTIVSFVQIALVWFISRVLQLIAKGHFMVAFITWVMLALTLLNVTGLLNPIVVSLSEIAFDFSNIHLSLLGVIKGTFALFVLMWGAGELSRSGENWIRRMKLSFNARELAIKFLRIGLYFIAGVFTLNVMGVDLTTLTVFGGAVAVGVGFGLQKITSNFVSGIILLFGKTVENGDLIEIGSEKGWVRQIAIRNTRIETFDGRDILIPNEDLITGKVINWTYTNTRARIDISATVLYASDPMLVQKLLLDAAKSLPGCISDPAPACWLREFNDHGMQFQLVFWIPDVKQGLSGARSEVMLRIVQAFREQGITFATA